jgi:hypothetical protein
MKFERDFGRCTNEGTMFSISMQKRDRIRFLLPAACALRTRLATLVAAAFFHGPVAGFQSKLLCHSSMAVQTAAVPEACP